MGDDHSGKPRLSEIAAPKGACWAVKAEHPTLGTYFLYGRHQADTLYTENESNAERLWGPQHIALRQGRFHRYLIHGEQAAVNPAKHGTKFTGCHVLTVAPAASRRPLIRPCRRIRWRHRSASVRGSSLTVYPRPTSFMTPCYQKPPRGSPHQRQALAGMIWCQQFFHYDVRAGWTATRCRHPESRKDGRNRLGGISRPPT